MVCTIVFCIMMYSVITAQQLANRSKAEVIRPHLMLFIRRLLESISENESSAFNSVAVSANENQLEMVTSGSSTFHCLFVYRSIVLVSQVDDARVASSTSTPMMDSLISTIRMMDSDAMTEIPQVMSQLLRSSAEYGVATRCSTLIFIDAIISYRPVLLRENRDSASKA